MKKMPLEQRAISDSRLAFGCMSLGGGWNRDPLTKQDAVQAEAAIEAALEAGMTMFDHADIYKMGKSEIVFSQVLKQRPELREKIVLQSKCGIRFPEGEIPHRFDFSKAHIAESVDGILDRLGIETLDILLLHRPDPLMDPDEVAEAFERLVAAGKVKHFGVSNMNAAQMRFLQRSLNMPLIANQLEMNLAKLDWVDEVIHVNQQAGAGVHFGDGILEYCRTENVQVQAWSPLARGVFSGRDISGEPERIQKTAELVGQMAEAKKTTPEAIVLGWLMRHPALIQPIIGTASPERILACKDAVRQSETMTREEWYKLYISARGKSMP